MKHYYYFYNKCVSKKFKAFYLQYTQERMVTWVTKKKLEFKFKHSPKAYGLIKVTASKFSLLKVETMRKSFYLNDDIFKVKSVLEKISNISKF